MQPMRSLNCWLAPKKLHLAIHYFEKLNEIEVANTPCNKLVRHQYFLYNTIVSVCCAANDLPKAMEFYALMKKNLNQLPDLKTTTKLFTLICKDNCTSSVSDMLSILNDMTSRDITPYPLVYNLTLSKCVSQNDIKLAKSVFEQMKSFNITPTAVTYSIIIKGYLAEHNLAEAKFYFNEMISQPNASESSQFMNSIGPFNAMIQYYIQQSHSLIPALEIFDLYEQKYAHLVPPSGFTFHLLILGVSMLDHPKKAMRFLKHMKTKYQISPNGSHFVPILEEFMKRNLIRAAKYTVDDVLKRQYHVEIRGEAIERIVSKIESMNQS